jgi:hypothetical protein
MSLLPALFKARKREDDAASPPKPASDSRETDSPPKAAEDNVFELVPPEKIHDAYRVAQSESAAEPEAPAAAKKGRNIHPLAIADLSRLSIDDDGRLYWDGKPVEVRRRIEMSRAQVVGAIIQGSLALRDWGCRLGWTTSYCGVPAPARLPRLDIPA